MGSFQIQSSVCSLTNILTNYSCVEPFFEEGGVAE